MISTSRQTETIPGHWYTSQEMFEMEQRQVFERSWQYVGMCHSLTEPGDFLTAYVGRIPVIVLRARDGELRGFVNVCRHRGSVIVSDVSGRRNALQCPYHAWTYDLDGKLRAAPGAKDEEDFDPADFGLRSVGLGCLGPFLFVNPDFRAPSLETICTPLHQLVAETRVRLDHIKGRVRRRFEIAANWKVVVDNYLECYHCPVAHPTFCDLIDVRDYTVTEYEYFSTQRAPQRKTSGSASTGPVTEGFHAYLWPNFTINIYPGPGNVSVNLFRPIAADRTEAVFDYCFVEGVSEAEIEEFAAFIDQVQAEDTALCESVQKGLASGMLNRGRIMLSKERAIAHFQQLLRRELSPGLI